MSCDVDKATEQSSFSSLSVILTIKYITSNEKVTMFSRMGGSPGELSEELVTQEKRKEGWRMNCHVGEATEGLDNEL